MPGSGFALPGGEFLHVLELRCLPAVLGKKLLYGSQPQGIPPTGAHPFYCTVKFREMVSAIKERPQGGCYHFLHLILPHPPYLLNEHGEYVGPEKGSRYGQVLTIDRLVGELIAELKRRAEEL